MTSEQTPAAVDAGEPAPTAPAGQAEVLCLDCDRPVTNPASRARRIGEMCWRKRRRAARAAGPIALPGLSGYGPPAVDQPDLFDVDDAAAAEAPGGGA